MVARVRSLLSVVVVALVWLSAARAQARGPSREAIERMLTDVAGIAQAHGVPGVGIALVDADGVMMAGGVGHADVGAGRGVGPDTCFRVGSISKTFVALTVMRLVERGELELDRPIHEYAPDLVARNPWDAESPVTLAHVLEHTAGFDDMHFNESGSANTPEMSVDDALAINPRSRNSRWRPGSRMAYANPGTTVAAHVIERVTGEPFERVVQREVLEPMGLAPAGYRRTPALDACLAQGYGGDGAPLPYWSTPHRPAGHLMLSSRQLGKLVQLFLRRGEGLLSPESIARMERSETRARSIEEVAYGLANYGDVTLPRRARGHDGGMPGFVSQYRYFPELGVGYVLLYNTSSGQLGMAHHQIRQRVYATLTEGMNLSPAPTYAATPAELERWVGAYEPVAPRHEIFAFIERLLMTLRIESGADGLEMHLGIGVTVPLVPAGPDQLTFPGMSGPLLQLHEDGTLLLGDATYERRPVVVVEGRRQAVLWSIRLVAVAPLLLVLLSFGRHRKTSRRVLGPVALAVASLWLLVLAFVMGVRADALGHLHPWSATLFAATLLAPASAGLATARSIRALRGRAPWLVRVIALVVALACFVLVVWLRSGHFLALRTWAW